MGFRELARWRIFSESLANGLWRTDTLKNLWPLFGESLANLWRMILGNSHVGESLANSFWRTDTLANLWRIFGEWLLRK